MTPLIYGERHESGPSFLSGLVGSCFSREVPQMMGFAVDPYSRRPGFVLLVPIDSTIYRRSATARNILEVSGLRCDAEVRSPIVQPIPIDVIPLQPVRLRESEQDAMQPNPSLFPVSTSMAAATTTDAGAATRCVSPVQHPAPLVDPLGISSIDKRVGSDATVTGSKGDTYGILKAHRLPPVGGVTPRGAINTCGATACLNFTRLGIV